MFPYVSILRPGRSHATARRGLLGEEFVETFNPHQAERDEAEKAMEEKDLELQKAMGVDVWTSFLYTFLLGKKTSRCK